MKVSDLIETLEAANKLFKKKHKIPMEIFDLHFNQDDYDGDLHIRAVGQVSYDDDSFGCGQRTGKKPHEDIRIHFEVQDGGIVGRSVSFEKI